MDTRRSVIAAALAVAGAHAQQAAPQEPRFDVVSVKPNKAGDTNGTLRGVPGGIAGTNMPLRPMITFAYGVGGTRLVGGPDWIATERYDITARFSELPPTDPAGGSNAIAVALRGLLADRFGLKVHREMREMDVYALVVARPGTTGPGLKPSPPDSCTTSSTPPGRVCGMQGTPGRIRFGGQPLSMFAQNLGGPAGRVVIDRTGLTGNYDFELTFTPNEPVRPGGDLPVADPGAASIFVALQEQLGLKLEPTRAPVEVVVIDSIARPTPD